MVTESNVPALSLRDLIDSQLETQDGIEIGRVSDVLAQWSEGGTLHVTHVVVGPQALAGRIATPLRNLLRALLHDRFDHCIPLSEVEQFGATLRLRQPASNYEVGKSDAWIAKHILRWIPGSSH
ncbi:hypothetical protein EPA93_04885 [Ktedonosporobacter rubrisoli]|uniref:PRC-barrel domain containing protein n=1 Tax=Ktedonosporobacter rubrisoli TaxID=2509675 RepID=A0A4V0YY88_KTERU|nr:hypothetical protein [Ktedonosporobacter rubrisoli]QBD75371.1 hypothetical protein EPA93_04885 [Ktedonosporobacter rubrisoli]